MMNAPEPLTKSRTTLVLATVAVSSFLAAYYPIFKILFEKWADSEEYSHAFLTLPIIAYMVYRNRSKVTAAATGFPYLGLGVVLVSSFLYLFSLLTEVHTVIALAMYLTVIGCVILLFGIQALRQLFTPLLLLLMLIPVPDQLYIQLTFPLQLMMSQASAAIIQLFNIPVHLAGNVISIPERTFEVVEACSGLRSVITLMTLSVIMGYFMLSRFQLKLLLLAASIPIAIFVNLIRVVAIVLLFHFFGLDLYTGTLHTITGLLIFLIALATLFALQRILERWDRKYIATF